MNFRDTNKGGRLLSTVTCPNCWEQFPPEQLLFVAQHADLVGDDVAGPEAYRRFLPMDFSVSGNAIDARGMECADLACPRCHLVVSRPLVELAPRFISTIGAPASGKSYFLAVSTWQMRTQAARFKLTYADGDAAANQQLQQYEELLFLNGNADQPVEIRKTEEHGAQLHQTVLLDGQRRTFPRPFVFTINPARNHPQIDNTRFPRHSLVLYDNAGEHFLPGRDEPGSPVTLHVARSAALLFVFDPTQDPRFREECRDSNDPQLRQGARPDREAPLMRQEMILREVASRIRRQKGLSQTQQHQVPLLIVLAKADIWQDLIDLDLESEPILEQPGGGAAINIERLQDVSNRCRSLMEAFCPEIVTAAEDLSPEVRFIPVSALGRSPEVVERDGRTFYGIAPRDIRPRWATVPMLWALSRIAPAAVPVHQPPRPTGE